MLAKQRSIVRAINPSDMSVVISHWNWDTKKPGGLHRCAARAKALVFDSLSVAIMVRDAARKENKSAWIAFV